MSMPTVRPRRWTRLEYERMVDAGIFGPQDRIELLDGEIVEMTPQGAPHTSALVLLDAALRPGLPEGVHIRQQGPLALDDRSEPEPDLAVVRGSLRTYVDQHPHTALLVVEISESSLHYDRTHKLAAYARNGVPEYWILNLVDRQLEVFRRPEGGTFADADTLATGDRVTPLFAPDVPLTVADLLP